MAIGSVRGRGRSAMGKAGQAFISGRKNIKFKANTQVSVLWTL